MNIAELSLRRPVLAVVMNIIIVLFGVIGFRFLGVRDYPAIDPPNISVRTSYAGANPDIIETQITEPLEKTINGIAGIRPQQDDCKRNHGDGCTKCPFQRKL